MKTTTQQPSPGAIRAAKRVHPQMSYTGAASIIDQETHAAELLAACKAAVDLISTGSQLRARSLLRAAIDTAEGQP